ncbi:MAG: POTRA domain-containing protein [Candidatus Korobacteraceae bacterium]
MSTRRLGDSVNGLSVMVKIRRGWMATALLLAAVLCLPATAAGAAASGTTVAGGTVNASLPAGGAQSGNASLPAAGAQVPESALPGAETGLLGHVVEEIRVIVAGGQESGWLKEIPLKVGERLERDKVRESLRALYRSGRFAEVEADVTVLPSGGVVVEFRTKPNYFNGNVTVTGLPKGGPNDSGVVSSAGLELGAEFTEESLKDSEQRIALLLQRSGYWMAQVDAKLERHDETQQVDVEFHVAAGLPARVGKLMMTGDPALTSVGAVAICRLRPGARVRRDALQRAVARLRMHYMRQRRLAAQLTAGPPVFHPESNTVDYSIAVEPGPVVGIRVVGLQLSRETLKRYVPVWEEHAVDEDLLNEGRRNLVDYLQGEGYFKAQVQVKRQDEADQHLEIVYSIQPGERYMLRAIALEGNKRFDDAMLRERMGTQVAGMQRPHGHYSETQVNDDLQAIETLYRANGYPSVKATSQMAYDYQGMRGDVKLVVKVDEGPLVRVRQLEIRGAKAVNEEELRRLINAKEGQPYSESTIADDREVVLNDYFNRGFPSVQMETSANYTDASHTWMDVVYEIQEGAQEFVGKVLVSGVEHTKPRIVQHAVVIHEGAPLSQDKMLLSQRNLYDLGIFNEVQTAIQDPEGVEVHKNVLFEIQEARRWTIDYGGGLEVGTGLNTQGGSPQGQTGASPRAILNITRINFGGRDQSLSLKSHVGFLEKQASLNFDQTHWFDLTNWRLTLTALYDNTQDVNTFSSSREEGALQLTQRVTRATQLLYRFSFRRITVDPSSFPAGFTPSLIPLYSKPVLVGMPSLIFLRDTRDDPVNSTKGTYTTVDLGLASSAFASQANFGRVLAQNASYHKFFRGWVFARSIRIGTESPYGNGTVDFIPLPERYFVGGSNSHRGFAINQAGPRDPGSGFPVGGNAMVVSNLEFRSPPAPLPWVGNNLSFVFFHDMGNLFDTADDMWHNLARMNQRDQANCRAPGPSTVCNFSYMSSALGSGVRYKTPIGPVRLDFSYNVNPPWFSVDTPCAGVTTTPCNPTPYVERVRHFNFFFSIGQTF